MLSLSANLHFPTITLSLPLSSLIPVPSHHPLASSVCLLRLVFLLFMGSSTAVIGIDKMGLWKAVSLSNQPYPTSFLISLSHRPPYKSSTQTSRWPAHHSFKPLFYSPLYLLDGGNVFAHVGTVSLSARPSVWLLARSLEQLWRDLLKTWWKGWACALKDFFATIDLKKAWSVTKTHNV